MDATFCNVLWPCHSVSTSTDIFLGHDIMSHDVPVRCLVASVTDGQCSAYMWSFASQAGIEWTTPWWKHRIRSSSLNIIESLNHICVLMHPKRNIHGEPGKPGEPRKQLHGLPHQHQHTVLGRTMSNPLGISTPVTWEFLTRLGNTAPAAILSYSNMSSGLEHDLSNKVAISLLSHVELKEKQRASFTASKSCSGFCHSTARTATFDCQIATIVTVKCCSPEVLLQCAC